MGWAAINWTLKIILLFHLPASGAQHAVEARLVSFLISNANATARPSKSSKFPVFVEFDMKLRNIEKLVITDEILISQTSVVMRWTDERLGWNPKDYADISLVNVPSQKIWTPDIVLYNMAEEGTKKLSDVYTTQVHVHSNGEIVWFSTAVWKSSCAVNVEWFPIDQQQCKLVFASKSYENRRLKLTLPRHHAERGAIVHGEWDIEMEHVPTLTEYKRHCCDDPFSEIIYRITLKRKPLYFLLYLILPMMAVVFLSILIFQIPAETGERVGFAVTILLTMGVYLMVISQDLPRKGDSAPLVGVLYVILFYVVVFGCVAGIMTTSIAYKFTKPPKCLHRLFLKITKSKSKKSGNFNPNLPSRRAVEFKDVELTDFDNQGEDDSECPDNRTKGGVVGNKATQVSRRKDGGYPEHNEREIDHKKEWEMIGYYIDRIFFWIYIVLVFGSSIAVFAYFRQ